MNASNTYYVDVRPIKSTYIGEKSVAGNQLRLCALRNCVPSLPPLMDCPVWTGTGNRGSFVLAEAARGLAVSAKNW
jgi:hypothetical protein